MKKEITVAEFAEAAKKDIDNFVKSWLEGQKNSPETYPEKLADEEFFEQFLCFVGFHSYN